MKKPTAKLAVLFALAVVVAQIALYGLAIYAVIHFVTKYW